MEFTDVHDIFVNERAYVALRKDRSLFGYDDSKYGSVAPFDLHGVKEVFSSAGEFAALRHDSSVVAFGMDDFGGSVESDYSSTCQGSLSVIGCYSMPLGLANVSSIYSTMKAFAAVNFDGSVEVWGDRLSGGDPSTYRHLCHHHLLRGHYRSHVVLKGNGCKEPLR